jgi:DNA-binding MarR family transcriptional regulator
VLKSEDLLDAVQRATNPARRSENGLPCGEIAARMITRDPDVTRLLDRLEKRELIGRCREAKDRRTVMARITRRVSSCWPGSMNRCRPRIARQLGHLGRERLEDLAELLRVSRSQVA